MFNPNLTRIWARRACLGLLLSACATATSACFGSKVTGEEQIRDVLAREYSMSAIMVRDDATAEYKHGDETLAGRIYAPANEDALERGRKYPGVMVVHQWMGHGEHEYKTAEALAKLGYVVLVADIYGKGVKPTNQQDAAAQATKYRSDRALQRGRAEAGIAFLQAQPNVDPSRVAAMGFCFGGGTVLELARSGSDVRGVISLHGNLDTPNAADAKNAKARILVLHGADDPLVPDAQVAAFQKEMRDAGCKWTLVGYGGAVHSYTEPKAGNNPQSPVRYDASAAAQAWAHTVLFLSEVLGGDPVGRFIDERSPWRADAAK